jgi:hypothetical protein
VPTDFSDYAGGDPIPPGTIATLQTNVRYGDGTDGVLRRTKGGDAEGLDLSFTVIEGPFAKRKFFAFMLVKGETEGQKSMAETNLSRLKQIIDSAKYLDPSDKSPEARAKRSLNWRDFDGVRFLAEIGIEAGRDGYLDKNIITKVITRDMSLWGGRPPIDQGASDFGAAAPQGGAKAPTAAVQKPSWAS